jgi:hypothetical protein
MMADERKEFKNVQELMDDIENDDRFCLFTFLEDSAVKHNCSYSLPQNMEDDVENLIREQQAEIERLREALDHAKTKMVSVLRSDLTPDYEYGKPNRLGENRQ